MLGLGFEGIWVDTWGYVDGTPAAEEIDGLSEVLGVIPMRSPDRRFLFFDLRPYRARLGWSDDDLRAETERVLGVTSPVGG